MGQIIEITVTTAATEGNPITGTVAVGRGLMRDIALRFASGCNGTVKVRIFKGLTQLFPRTEDGFYRLVVTPINVNDQEPLTDASTNIVLKGWADGSSFNHRVRLEFNVIPFDDPELIL
jgi:hypothetical protein